MKKIKLAIIGMLALGMALAGRVVPLQNLEKPDSITVSGDRVYITDRGTVSIYSTEDFKLIKTFGGMGEGPGEFKILEMDKLGLRLFAGQDQVMITSVGRLSYFTREGRFINEKRISSMIQTFRPFGDKLVGFERGRIDGEFYFFIHLYEPATLKKGKPVLQIKSFISENSVDALRFALLLKRADRRAPMYQVTKSRQVTKPRLFIEGPNGLITVHDLKGNQINAIDTHKHRKIEVTDDFKKKVMDYLRKRLLTTWPRIKRIGVFPRYFPLRSLRVADGKLYVQTFRTEEEKSEFFVFDPDGKPLGKVMLPFGEAGFLVDYPFAIDKGKFYQLRENEETGDWEVRITGF